MNKHIVISLIFLISVFPDITGAQEFSVKADVDRTQVAMNDLFMLTVTLSGQNLSDVPEPQLPELRNFIIAGRTSSTSSSFNFINGKISTSQSIRYIYQLQPNATGRFVIDAVEVSYQNKTYRTDPITIDVVQGSAKPPPAQGGGRQGGMQRALPGVDDQTDLRENLFIRAEVDKKRAYVGEQVTITYKLYTRVGLANVRYEEMPSFTGFWMEEMFSAQHLDYQEEIIDGKRYAVSTLKRIALFPTVTGKQTVEPLAMLCDVQVARRRSLFDSFFDDPFDPMFSRTRQIKIASAKQSIEVMPLPDMDKPDRFKNAVGQFTVTAAVDRTEGQVSQPVTLTVTLSGRGNLKTLEAPELPELPNFKRYESESKEDIKVEGRHIGGSRTYSYVLIPVLTGEHEIESITFPYFDPEDDSYKTATSEPIAVTVAPGAGGPVVDYSPKKEEVTQIRQDIQYIKPITVNLGDQGRLLFRTPWYLLLHALPVAAIVGVLLYKARAQKFQNDTGYARWRKAHGLARRELQEAKNALKANQLDQTYTHISNALYRFIADKTNQPTAGLTTPQIIDLLSNRQIDEDLLEQLRQCLDACDMARFAPTMLTEENTQEILDTSARIVNTLEQKISKE